MERGNFIRVLGPIDLLTPDGARSVGGRSARTLLGALVLAAGRTVSADQLQMILWGDSPPHSADSSLQTYVWRLRRLLGPDTLLLTDHSYRLDARRDQIDALCFQDLLVEATDRRTEPDRCSELCGEALSLWRGRPFGELADEEPFRLEAMRLDELRLTTMELFLEAEVTVGHHEIAVAELECAVEEHPFRERMWHLLIEALRRDDRRVDALRACNRLRAALAAAGLEPNGELERIETKILREHQAATWMHGRDAHDDDGEAP